MYCPLPYLDNLTKDAITKLRDIMGVTSDIDFTVIVDGIELRKPLESFMFTEKEMPIREIFVWTKEEYSKGSYVSGYLINRQRIRPKSMQGILVRQDGVAIGGYDLTFLEYPYFEAAKFEQLTGELFVSGLSSAMNIDRNSFNETDDNYLALVKWFHGRLHDEVFKKIQQKLGEKRKTDRIEDFKKTTKSFFARYNKKRSIEIDRLGKDHSLFVKRKNTLTINRDHRNGKLSGSNYGHLLIFSLLVSSDLIDANKAEELIENLSKAEGE
jgi:hypothetical protein